jgi:hypothetical protein
MSEAKFYPARKFDPKTGESQVFNAAADVPDGWLDHPNAPETAHKTLSADEKEAIAAKEAEAAAEAALPMDRSKIVEALNLGEIPFKKKASTVVLYNLLRDSAMQALTDAGVAFDTNSDAPTLLELLTRE